MGFSRCSLTAAILILVTTSIAEAGTSIDEFFGAYEGSGFVIDSGVQQGISSERQFVLEIVPFEGEGFTIKSATTEKVPSVPNPDLMPKVWASVMSFRPTDEIGVYDFAERGDVLTGGTLSWARISGDLLVVYRMEIDDEGIPELQIFRRTLTATGLELTFTAHRDGVTRRTVRGLYLRH